MRIKAANSPIMPSFTSIVTSAKTLPLIVDEMKRPIIIMPTAIAVRTLIVLKQ